MFGLKETDKTYSVDFALSFKGDSETQRPWQLQRDVSLPSSDVDENLTRALEKSLEAFFAGINDFPAGTDLVKVKVTRFVETSLRK